MINPITTKIKLATCNRCSGYVFSGQSDGLKSAADPEPLTWMGYIAALAAGLRVFDLTTQAGRPHKLVTRTIASEAPPFTSEGLSEPSRPILAEHSCGAAGMDAAQVEEIPQDPRQAPATPGRGLAGHHPTTAPDKPSSQTNTDPYPAEPANPRPSDPHCGRCGFLIRAGQEHWGFQHGEQWVYAEHVRCADEMEKEADPG